MEASRQEPQRRGTGKQKRSRSHGFLFGQHLSSEGFQAWHESSVEKPCGLARGVEVAAERTPWVGPQWQQGSKGQKKLTAQLAGHERNHNARRAGLEVVSVVHLSSYVCLMFMLNVRGGGGGQQTEFCSCMFD